MRQVEVTADLRAQRQDVLDALGPEALIRLEGTYEVDAVREAEGGWLVTASTIVGDEIVEMTLSVDTVENGYAYELVDGGFFEELHTTILVTDPPAEVRAEIDAPDLTRVTLNSTFTFGGPLARVKDWFATSNRRTELRRAVARLGEEVTDERDQVGGETDDGDDDRGGDGNRDADRDRDGAAGR
ncbi:hypothetical protein [Halorubrum vacuolatum]|uniref:Polyketide cyclase / dehydrase and lipid transport n=1 Tax=Halorubrum vacuolatum TaxID=63740 RepID=A0A238UQH7_HALVU|nr:hypothetical protein [Halorubrum vacuolatum]SNR24392.1 hypothetical protein SAMN06264855_101258 [Halorubrum vacuolatum]